MGWRGRRWDATSVTAILDIYSKMAPRIKPEWGTASTVQASIWTKSDDLCINLSFHKFRYGSWSQYLELADFFSSSSWAISLSPASMSISNKAGLCAETTNGTVFWTSPISILGLGLDKSIDVNGLLVAWTISPKSSPRRSSSGWGATMGWTWWYSPN